MPSRITQGPFKLCKQVLSLLVVKLLPEACAQQQANTCTTLADTYIGNSQDKFRIGSWMSRGICIRSNNVDKVCYATLEATLKNLAQLRLAEYSGAAGVLALLPTIGALLGAPTTEIWRLLTVIPFGGGLAMTLSFGGAILPVRVEDYQNDSYSHRIALGKSVPIRPTPTRGTGDLRKEEKEELTGFDLVVEKIEERMRQDKSRRLAKGHVSMGLLGMILLFLGAQFAMSAVEQGGVLPWWCTSRWWMHLWYFMVTFTAIAENWAQLPFKENWKLYVSDIPYDISVQDGDNIHSKFQDPTVSVQQVLRELASLKAGTATLYGSKQYTRPRNSVLVMVSVVNQGEDPFGSFWRLLSKCLSIATFVVGTALFASVQLLALPMAVMVLVLILAAGVFGRAIIGWIVSGVSETEPLIHVIVDTKKEAHDVIARILSLGEYGGKDSNGNKARKVQVELGGHIFVSQCRVARRSPWYIRTLGVLAEPFDLRKVDNSMYNQSKPPEVVANHSQLELGLVRE